jgi:hypothetical protein
MYSEYLKLKSVEHTSVRINQYLEDFFNEICPSGGEFSYLVGEVHCSLHSEEDKSGEDDDQGNVPFL